MLQTGIWHDPVFKVREDLSEVHYVRGYPRVVTTSSHSQAAILLNILLSVLYLSS